jgi:hypothetical protein
MARKKQTLQRDKIITEARARYERAQEVWGPIYKECREDMRFSDPTDPQQWPEDVKRERQNAEGGARPCLVFDQTSQFVRQVINTARRNKPALSFLPVDDTSDPKLAEVLAGLAKQTEYASRADVAYITALGQSTRGGIGWFRLVLKPLKGAKVQGQQCAEIERVPEFEAVLVDPDFTQPDGSDMGWGFVEVSMHKDDFKAKWPDATMVDWDDSGWFTKDHVRVCEYYRVVDVPASEDAEGGRVVEHFKLSGEDVLERSVFPAEFVPLFPVLGNEEWDEGKRRLSGCVRLAKDGQITYNFERNAAYEAVALGPKAPWLAPAEAIEGYEGHWKQANRGNIAYLPYNTVDEHGNPLPFKPERISPAGVAVGWADLAERSKNDIQAALGMYQAAIGNNPNQQSGRAVLALQDKADVGSFHYVDNLALSIAHLGRVLTQVWPVIYDQEQVLRIIGKDDEPEFVRVDPTMETGYQERPSLNGKKEVVVNPAVGRYDVRAVVGPAFQTRQQEAAAEIGEMVNGNPQLMAILGDLWVKLRNFPDADKISRRLKAMLPPQVQQAESQEEGAPQIPPQVEAALQQAGQEIQQLRQALQEAQSGMQAKQLDAQVSMQLESMRMESAERIAALQADAAQDREELKGLIALLKQQMQPPPQLAAAVSQDMT